MVAGVGGSPCSAESVSTKQVRSTREVSLPGGVLVRVRTNLKNQKKLKTENIKAFVCLSPQERITSVDEINWFNLTLLHRLALAHDRLVARILT